MTLKFSNDESGFIALISVIIMSAVLIAVTVALSTTGFFGRFSVLYSEYKNISSGLAEGCADTAMLKLINDPSYSPSNESVPMGSNFCTIVSVVTSGSQKIIRTKGIYPASGQKLSYTYLQVIVTPATGSMTVNSWVETPN